MLQVPEADYARLPELLERYVGESEERGRRARETWERFFAPEVAFDYLIDQMIEIQRERIIPEKIIQRIWPLLQLRADARLRLSSRVRKSRFKLRSLLGKKDPPKGFVTSDLD